MLVACNNENVTQDIDKKDEVQKGGVIFSTEVPRLAAKHQCIYGDDEIVDAKTRTNIKHTPGQGADFVWTSDDFIWVKDRNGNWRKSTATVLYNEGRKAAFTLPGSMSDYNDGCEVRYTNTTNGGNENANTVFIDNTVYAGRNDFRLAGKNGDCGSGVAHNVGTSMFSFTIAHKAAYLCFLPRCSHAGLVSNINLVNFIIKADNKNDASPAGSITGPFHFDGENLTRKSSPVFGKEIFVWANTPLYTETRHDANAAYVVIRPGTYDLEIEYRLKDPITNVTKNIRKTFMAQTLEKGKIYDITVNFAPEYEMGKYYMWDARKDYWWGHELDQPFSNNYGGPNWPKNKTDDPERWFNDGGTGTMTVPVRYDAQSELFRKLPNANEMMWYAYHGDPHFESMGYPFIISNNHLISAIQYRGVWLKKKAKIMADEGITKEQMENGYPKHNPIDWRRQIDTGRWPAHVQLSTAPVPNTTDYFFLPLFGKYIAGTMREMGERAYYWSSSSWPYDNYRAYVLAITINGSSKLINCGYQDRQQGYAMRMFE